MHKYLVAAGLQIDRHVFTPLFVPFCENGPQAGLEEAG